MCQPRPLFCFIIVLFKYQFYRKNCRLMRHSNSVCQSEGEHTDQLITTITASQNFYSFLFWIKVELQSSHRCRKQISDIMLLFFSEMSEQSDSLKLVMWLKTSNHSALFQIRLVTPVRNMGMAWTCQLVNFLTQSSCNNIQSIPTF